MQRALGAGYVPPSATLRLQNQNGAGCGRVEVLYQGLWGTVCDDDWDIQDAMVACRQLGLEASSFSIWASYGQGVGMVWMDKVECNGTEPGLESCPRNDWGSHDCSSGKNAGVCCELRAKWGEASLSLSHPPPPARSPRSLALVLLALSLSFSLLFYSFSLTPSTSLPSSD